MNLQAVALGADSAMTVSRWIGGKEERRYFKGTNKIFELSSHQPVGLMIYGTAGLQGVPWELIVKDFRRSLGAKSFNSLSDYALELFVFIKNHPHLFPRPQQETLFKDEARKAAMIYLLGPGASDPAVQAATDDAARAIAYASFVATKEGELDAIAFSPQLTQAELDAAATLFGPELTTAIASMLATLNLDAVVNPASLARLAIKALFKEYGRFMSSTGIVIAGYGDNDYFPKLHEFNVYGVLLGTFLYEEKFSKSVDLASPTYIKAFAMTDMVTTFLMGFSPSLYYQMSNAFEDSVKTFTTDVMAELNIAAIPNVDALRQAAATAFENKLGDISYSDHFSPLMRVVGSLPIDEMADLAETLVMLQSLKEKVTQPTESVGGPIDVAVISKGDGFVWVKRKHYFQGELNRRFFARQALEYDS